MDAFPIFYLNILSSRFAIKSLKTYYVFASYGNRGNGSFYLWETKFPYNSASLTCDSRGVNHVQSNHK